MSGEGKGRPVPSFRTGPQDPPRSSGIEEIGPVFDARFPGWCRNPLCDDDIDEGDPIQMVDGESWHAACVAEEQQPGGILA